MGKPDFFILGAQRAGTTSLAAYLAHHPKVFFPICRRPMNMRIDDQVRVLAGKDMIYIGTFLGGQEFSMFEPGAVVKEPSYFSRFHCIMTIDDYFDLFVNDGNGNYSFDASAEYFDMEGVPERIKEMCPDAKFIIMLRDPIKRIWSHYWHEVNSNKSETLPFDQAIQRTAPCFCTKFFFSYLSRGLYAIHLEKWFSMFPRDQFRIYFMEEFFNNPEGYFYDVQHWLKLDPVVTLEKFPKHNYTADSYPEMPEEYIEPLRAFYEPFNERLKALLGRKELPW